MAVPTLEEFKIFLFIPVALTKYDANLQALLNEATEQVKDDSIESDHDKFKRLNLLKGGVLIASNPTLSGLIKTSETDSAGASGVIKKEKVADVEVEYFQGGATGSGSGSDAGGNIEAWMGGNYERDYFKLLQSIVGYAHIFGE